MKTAYKKIFFDTAPIIYFLERKTEHYADIASLIKTCRESVLVSSAITVMEYLTWPYRAGDAEAVDRFTAFLADYAFTILPIDGRIAEQAAKIRAEYRQFKAMDALQLAAASLSGCDAFLTNDRQLRQFTGLPVLLVDGLRAP